MSDKFECPHGATMPARVVAKLPHNASPQVGCPMCAYQQGLKDGIASVPCAQGPVQRFKDWWFKQKIKREIKRTLDSIRRQGVIYDRYIPIITIPLERGKHERHDC